jgi:hypothetical protein
MPPKQRSSGYAEQPQKFLADDGSIEAPPSGGLSVEFDIAGGLSNIPPQIVWDDDGASVGLVYADSLPLPPCGADVYSFKVFLHYTTAESSASYSGSIPIEREIKSRSVCRTFNHRNRWCWPMPRAASPCNSSQREPSNVDLLGGCRLIPRVPRDAPG